jgi:hypothetical protein
VALDANHSVYISWWFRTADARLAPGFSRYRGESSIDAECGTSVWPKVIFGPSAARNLAKPILDAKAIVK